MVTLKDRHLEPSYTLKAGVTRFAKSKLYKRQAVTQMAAKKDVDRPTKEEINKAFFVEKKTKAGGSRLVRAYKVPPKYTPGGLRRKAKESQIGAAVPKLKKSLTPGTIVIILKGHYAGHRCVFLKQLAGGLLLLAGPFKINGFPVRRFDQSFVMATCTKVDISKVAINDKINDELFKKVKVEKPKDGVFERVPEKEFYAPKGEKLALLSDLDKQVVEAVMKHPEAPMLKKYLKGKFSLEEGKYPHNMKF